jgi:hypothetical protein
MASYYPAGCYWHTFNDKIYCNRYLGISIEAETYAQPVCAGVPSHARMGAHACTPRARGSAGTRTSGEARAQTKVSASVFPHMRVDAPMCGQRTNARASPSGNTPKNTPNTHTHTSRHTHTHIHIHTHTHTHTRPRARVQMRVRAHTYTHALTLTHSHTPTHSHAPLNTPHTPRSTTRAHAARCATACGASHLGTSARSRLARNVRTGQVRRRQRQRRPHSTLQAVPAAYCAPWHVQMAA